MTLKICQKWSVWTIDLFTVAWECIWSEEDEADCDKEMEKEKVRMRLYRKIFNARCNTTFNWHKRNAMIKDRVNFRGTLRVKSMGKTESQANSMSEVFDNLEDDVMCHGVTTTTIKRVIAFEEEAEETKVEPKKKKQKITAQGVIAQRLAKNK